MIDEIQKGIESAFKELLERDGDLFVRDSHEVCINSKLRDYLEQYLFGVFDYKNNELYTDIEFNREGDNPKKNINGELVRPDIIIHNRKSGADKNNILVVECKKYFAPSKDVE
ncbi:MAG: hypothetical protein PHV59_00805 [Victivallales bacterium]|nr:hypothetical protein [Victivallales bacterium]